jgi:hypothetical protein
MAVLCLSAPSAVGVFKALEPTRGPIAAGLAAAGFELSYLSLSLLVLHPELRRQARAVALGAVITAIVLNGLADYSARVADGLSSWPNAVRLFDPLALALAILESAPLAGLAYALASLLHRLAEATPAHDDQPAQADPHQVAEPAPALAWAREDDHPAPELVDMGHTEPAPDEAEPVSPTLPLAMAEMPASLPANNNFNTPVRTYRCRHCGEEGLTKSQQLAHGRQHAAAARRAAQG